MIKLIDQTGREVVMANLPERIISTVPSQTELIFHLGLGKKLIGRTRFCIHPRYEVKKVENIGGTKSLKIDQIRALAPDLIVANKEENEKAQIEELAKEFPVYLSDITNISSSYKMIEDVATLTGTIKQGNELLKSLSGGFSSLPKYSGTVAYLIWFKPIMVSASQTFIHEVLNHLGFDNAFANNKRYPELSFEDLSSKNPDYVFLSSEPFPFKEKHIEIIKEHCPKAKVILVDGEMFSWYGSRMLKAIEYFKELGTQL